MKTNIDFFKQLFSESFISEYEHKSEFKYWNFINKPIRGCVMFVVFQDSNGHCMFIDDIIENTGNSFILRVIDSTHYSHKNDTRTDTGIGMGDVEISYKDGIWFYNANNQSLPIRQADIYFVMPKIIQNK